MARVGSQNILLAAVFAVLTYLPFRVVAKFTIQFCALLFIIDPIPPYSRLLSLIAVGVVYFLSKWDRQFSEQVRVDADASTVEEDHNLKENETKED